jgi:23S rRNA (cytidine1920-2'-O)/16S rRNA (cytidine1409-2'-O)-methyltransferase
MSFDDRAIRLDVELVRRRLARSRAQARDLILRGAVTVEGSPADKAGRLVRGSDVISVSPTAAADLSRAAVKLRAALDEFGFAVTGRIALDIGASTGGFTQVLLERGAGRVFAVDVGRDQLQASLRVDRRVVCLEGVDARALTRDLVPDPINALVADVSFISLTKVLPAALALAGPRSWLVALVKPQFEVGRAGVGKGGIVRSAAERERALDLVRVFMAEQPGWRVVGSMVSPIAGGSGNVEFLLGAVRDG